MSRRVWIFDPLFGLRTLVGRYANASWRAVLGAGRDFQHNLGVREGLFRLNRPEPSKRDGSARSRIQSLRSSWTLGDGSMGLPWA